MNVIGLDIGGTKCAVILGSIGDNGSIEVIDKTVSATADYKGPDLMLPQLDSGIYSLMKKHGLKSKEVQAIGISCGGPLDSKKGIIMSPPNLPGWDDVHIVDYFEKRTGIPTFVQNDANACALAEWQFGAGHGTNNMIFLTFGTGMGAGLIIDGRLYSGTNDNAGEVGHIRLSDFGPVGYGKSGSFEGFCSGGGIAQLARQRVMEKLQMGEKISFCKDMSELSSITAQTVADAANKGSELALSIYETCGSYLGRGLSILIDILNPECIVIGSIYVRSAHLLTTALEKSLTVESLPLARSVCRIVPAQLEESIGDIASLSVAATNIN